jgi:hypothetical protein
VIKAHEIADPTDLKRWREAASKALDKIDGATKPPVDATKPATKPFDATKPTGGRPRFGDRAMTSTERSRLHRNAIGSPLPDSNTVAEIQPDQIRHILARIEGKLDALAALVLGQIERLCPPPNQGR